jgi:hypothetical protein
VIPHTYATFATLHLNNLETDRTGRNWNGTKVIRVCAILEPNSRIEGISIFMMISNACALSIFFFHFSVSRLPPQRHFRFSSGLLRHGHQVILGSAICRPAAAPG